MQVFISSLISGFERERAAVKRAIEVLHHRPIMAEDFGAQTASPQVACLNGLRGADLVVLVLGDRYGTKQASGLSATHEEYREARGRKPIIVFMNAPAPEPDQIAFIQEISGWEQGLFRDTYSTPEELGERVTRVLHRFEQAQDPADSLKVLKPGLKSGESRDSSEQKSLLDLQGSGRGLWGRDSGETLTKLRDEWSR